MTKPLLIATAMAFLLSACGQQSDSKKGAAPAATPAPTSPAPAKAPDPAPKDPAKPGK